MDRQSHFELLGLPRQYALDLRALEQAYLARSRDAHPDYHHASTQSVRQNSLDQSATLNDAYATLREPFRRAEYLLHLLGGPSASEHKTMSPVFLEEMLDLRMQIEEARAAGPTTPATGNLQRTLTQRYDDLLAAVALDFERDTSPTVFAGIRQRLNALRYIQGLLRDLQADDHGA